MKYWLFDGNDVIGPFAPQELAAREDFSANSLICSENASEDSAGWQMASFFDTFRFNEVTGRLENNFLPEGASGTQPEKAAADPAISEKSALPPKPPVVVSAVKSTAQPNVSKSKVTRNKQAVPSFIRLARVKSPETPPIPVALAQEDLDLILPAKSVHESGAVPMETPSAAPAKESVSVSKKETVPSPKKQATPVESPVSAPQPVPAETAQTKTVVEPKKGLKRQSVVEPEPEIEATCTLPLINEMAVGSEKSPLSEDEAKELPLTAIGAVSSIKPEEVAVIEPETPLQQIEEVVSQTPLPQENKVSQEEPAAVVEPVAYPLLQRPREKAISEIKQEFANQPEQEDLILEQQLFSRPASKKSSKAVWIIPLALGMIALLVGWAGMRAFSQRAESKDVSATRTTVQEELLSEPEVLAPVVQPKPKELAGKPVAPKPVSSSEKALSAVQNYQLPGNKGTIASYFDRIYQPNLEQGYTASWSVEPLHKNTYIVKYRLTKTRMEPIVYVFQADAVRGQLTGALNNVALDLVGRI